MNKSKQLISLMEEIEVSFEDGRLEMSDSDGGKLTGQFTDIEDPREGYPLGLAAYGSDVADEVEKKIEGIECIFYLEDIRVSPDARGKKLGAKMMKRMESEAKKKGADAVIANASPNGFGKERVPFAVLKSFYTKMGYEFLYIYQNKNGLIMKRL